MVSLPQDDVGKKRRLTRADYDVLVERGRFDGERLELIRGEIVEMSPQDAKHAAVVQRLDELLRDRLGKRASFRVQAPFAVGDHSEPEPDIAVVPRGEYEDDHPVKAFLLVEVSNTRLSFDRITKAALYAEAGVAEYWVVDVVGRQLEVHTKPEAGHYKQLVTHGRGEMVRLSAFPDVELAVDDIVR